ncbi:recombinase family protein [Mycobacterium avium]|uniref:recombinase family protein n=1 Tax=Mycobacterium avium TaxID=1764 RepID=UPI00211BD1F9|nr:recombinase family protein [Mycobacterium avium]
MAGKRVLGRLRLSRSSEESTSIERQREVIAQWSEANGHTVVGWAEDLDVSGSVDPFQAPALGPWLGDRAPDWDILCAWKLDRLSRSTISLNRLIGWCQDHGKVLVSATEGIDLGTPVGRLIANVIGFLAEGELEAIRERVKGSRRKLRESARWPGGKPPYGYMAVPREGGGWSLVIDPEASRVVRRIVDELLNGTPLTRIARELTSEGYRTPAQYYAALRGSRGPGTAPSEGASSAGSRQPGLRVTPDDKPGKWSSTPLRNMLRSKALRGYAHHRGETVRDEAGQPVQLAEPLVTLDEWELIQAALDQAARKGGKSTEVSPLSGLVVCLATCQHKLAGRLCPDDCSGTCGAPLYHERYSIKRPQYGKQYDYRYYRCRDRETCPSVMLPAEELEDLAEETFLRELGDQEVRERVWVPGDSHEAELREAITALDELSQAAGRAVSAAAKQRLQMQLGALDARIAELESAPAKEARWEWRATGETYRDAWYLSDTDDRRELLRRSGITFAARVVGGRGSNAREFQIRIPSEVTERRGLSRQRPRGRFP